MEFTLGACRLRVDAAANRAYYRARSLPWATCSCDGCRNFAQAVWDLPQVVTDFFAVLGLDPKKPAEIYAIDQEETPAICPYGGFYHLKGELLAGLPRPGQCCGEWQTLAEGFSVAFRSDCHLVPTGFPTPCVQMEIEFRLPWLLPVKNPYYYDC